MKQYKNENQELYTKVLNKLPHEKFKDDVHYILLLEVWQFLHT